MRALVLRRDGYRCVQCGCGVTSNTARVDHIVPMRHAPHLSLVPSNLRTLCTRCDGESHRERGTGSYVRIERFTYGHDEHGMPRDAKHVWYEVQCMKCEV
jgi:5-methylcytosine-specific restriction endonuclease McrA